MDRGDKEVALPLPFARAHIALWIRDPQVWPIILEICDELLGTEHPNPTLMGLEWLHDRVLDAFERGRLLLIDEEDDEKGAGGTAGGGGGGGSAAGEQPTRRGAADPTGLAGTPSSSPAADAPKEPPKTWFRARLLDEDGEPMAGEDYVLVDTDGVKRKGKLDPQGEVYIPPILPPGKCTISFPNIHLNPLKKK
jgi:hypothetical protein